MCFRPPVAGTSVLCPECGKKVNEVMGNYPNECPFCAADITAEIAKVRAAASSEPASAPASASAPMPAPPAAPAIPKVPGAPRP